MTTPAWDSTPFVERRARDIEVRPDGSLLDRDTFRLWMTQMVAAHTPARVERLSETDPFCQSVERERAR